MSDARPPSPRLASALAGLFVVGGAAPAIVAYGLPNEVWQMVLLAALAAAADALQVRFAPNVHVTAIDVVAQAAAVLLGPTSAIVVGGGATTASYGGHHAMRRLRRVADQYTYDAFAMNLAVNVVPVLLAGALVTESGLAGDDVSHGAFLIGAVVLPLVASALTLPVFALLTAIRAGQPFIPLLGAVVRDLWQTTVAQVLFVWVIAVLYDQAHVVGLLVACIAVGAFAYMARLLAQSREQTALAENRALQMTAMSWGVLSSLVRTLDHRNPAAARHSAAVAAFSRDIARHLGLGEEDQDLAHVSGLLHDIGKFALPDQVLDPGQEIVDAAPWKLIRRHPEIGAGMLADLTTYGPVAEIVHQHHERVDGRGYPRNLRGDEIHPIARIVAVAEVYDTITAPDTYRAPMSGLEVIQELRRVAGEQLDPDAVEAMIALLAGRDTHYRSAGAADYAVELAAQRELFLQRSRAHVGHPGGGPAGAPTSAAS